MAGRLAPKHFLFSREHTQGGMMNIESEPDSPAKNIVMPNKWVGIRVS